MVVGWVVEVEAVVPAAPDAPCAAAYCCRALANWVRKVEIGDGSVLVPVPVLLPVLDAVADPVPVVPDVWLSLSEVVDEVEAEALSADSLW